MPLTTRAQAKRYVASMARLMGLSDWVLIVSNEDPPEGSSGAVGCTPGRKVATIYFSESFYDDDDADQRNTVVHELLHCHHAHPDHIAVECLERGERDAWRLAMEYSVDAVATSWAKLLPLPK